MSIPKEPRALMIQLMYLVLTAMLALNITKEVLDAFSTINTSIETSNEGIKEKNQRMYGSFEAIGAKNPDLKHKADSLSSVAQNVKSETDKVIEYLENWKAEIVKKGGGWEEKNGVKNVKHMDDIDIPSRMFIEEKKGVEVRNTLQAYVDKVLQLAGGANTEVLKKQLPLQLKDYPKTETNRTGDWSFGTFHNIPVVAAITMFSKWQNDVRNSEGLMVENLMAQVGQEELDPTILKLDGIMPVAVPSTSYALEGEEITANITMAAYNTASNPVITSNRGAVPVKDGVGTLKFRASGTGPQTVQGKITLPTKGTKVETRDWKFTYTVGSAGASLQLDKMNVMYIGVDNPVTISASGYNIDDVKWNMDGATITPVAGQKGKYIVKVTKADYKGVPYSITATKNGVTSTVGSGLIRIKNFGAPTIAVGSVEGSGSMGVGELNAQPGIVAKLDTDFGYKYTVTRYLATLIPKGSDMARPANGKGNRFAESSDVQALIKSAKPGDRLIFENIMVKGEGQPDRPAKSSVTILVR